MPLFVSKYSDREKDAIRDYAAANPAATGAQIAELAGRGLLKVDGETVAPFQIPEATVRDLKRRARRKAEGLARTELGSELPRDALEILRRRLVSAADHKLARMERLLSDGHHDRVSGEDIRQVARAVREIAAIPGADGSPAARRPGEHIPGTGKNGATDGGRTRGGLAGSIFAAVSPAPVREDVSPPLHEEGNATSAELATSATDQREDERINATDSDDPGSYASARIAELAHPAEHGAGHA